MHSAMAQGGRGWRSEPTVGVARRAVLACTKKKRKKRKSSIFGLFGAVRRCSQVFLSARTIYAEVVDGEGEARSWRLRVIR